MRRRSTRLRIAFFSVLVVGLIFIQYSWLTSLQQSKLQAFKAHIISSVENTRATIPLTRSLNDLSATLFADLLRQSFSSNGLKNIRFEYSIGSGSAQLASPGYRQKLTDDANNLVFYYEFQPAIAQKTTADLLTVVIPDYKKIVFRDMGWIITASVLLTLSVLAILCLTYIISERKQAFYENSTNVIKNMMQQLETPLSTVSVAAEALHNAQVMRDSAKINYYQQIIQEENKRMHEQVQKYLRDMK
ncbi:hypothetical protein [Longitalea luteola]|uniref:hypothetical protein n=1 Tax=Longitalea luteola TaxID=2812563 RepID=UPI001A95844C|nr:hypothetical protein [Longitalea luteola]